MGAPAAGWIGQLGIALTFTCIKIYSWEEFFEESDRRRSGNPSRFVSAFGQDHATKWSASHNLKPGALKLRSSRQPFVLSVYFSPGAGAWFGLEWRNNFLSA
jgi:hypothetical protein